MVKELAEPGKHESAWYTMYSVISMGSVAAAGVVALVPSPVDNIASVYGWVTILFVATTAGTLLWSAEPPNPNSQSSASPPVSEGEIKKKKTKETILFALQSIQY